MLAQSHFVHGDALRGVLRFASSGTARYPVRVAETAASGRGNPLSQRRTTARAVFFRAFAFARLLPWRALVNGPASAGPLSFVSGFPPQKPCARHPSCGNESAGLSIAHKGGRFMRQSTHAHTGKPFPIIESIVRAALRNAATADTYQEALDATGAALAAIAALVRAEVQHG